MEGAEEPGGAPAPTGVTGNFAPVAVESTEERPLPMEGAVPEGLEGLLVRNGPNAVDGGGAPRWSDGDGMVHAIELRDGGAVSYRNRWVRTRRLSARLGTYLPIGPAEPLDNPANAGVAWVAGRLLALSSCGLPHRLDTDLRTLRLEDFGAMLESPVTAHLHHDLETGATAMFGYDPFGPPYLRYHELDADGQMVHSTDVPVARGTAQPDFAVSASRVAFFDMPAVLVGSSEAPTSGDPSYRWDPEAGARLGVLDRGGEGDAAVWLDVEPCFVSHVVNAFDDGERLVVDVVRYDAYGGDGVGHGGEGAPRLERWICDVAASRVDRTVLDDRAVELPRVDDVCAGRPYRYAYTVELGDGVPPDQVGLVRYDLVRDEAIHRPFPNGAPSEAIFVRAADGHADDEGWLLTVVYDRERGTSDLVILDASSLATAKPEAVIHLPARVPFGLHGSWVPASSYR